MLSNKNHLSQSFSFKKKRLETSITIPILPLLNSTRNINKSNKDNLSIGFMNINGIDYDNTRIVFDSMMIPRSQEGLVILKKKLNKINDDIQDMKIAILKLKNESNENRNFLFEIQKIKNILSVPFLSEDNSLNISFFKNLKKSNNESIKNDDKTEDKTDEKNEYKNEEYKSKEEIERDYVEKNINNIEEKNNNNENNVEYVEINKEIKIENDKENHSMSKIQEEEENSKFIEKSIDKEKNIKYKDEDNINSIKLFKYPNQENGNLNHSSSMKLIKSYNEFTSFPDTTINKIKNKNLVYKIKRKINKCLDKIKINNEEINELKSKSKSINYIEQNYEFFKLLNQINWLSTRNKEINNKIFPQKQQNNENSNNEFQYFKTINKANKDESELLKQKCSILKLENQKHNKNNIHLDEKINSIKSSLNSLHLVKYKKCKELKNLREKIEQIDILKEKINNATYTIESNESEINKLKKENNEKDKKIAKLESEKKNLLAKIEKQYKIHLKYQNEEKEKYNSIKESIYIIDKNIIKEKKEYKKMTNEKKLLENSNHSKKKVYISKSDENLYYSKKTKKKE